jgi:hypothetical protein
MATEHDVERMEYKIFLNKCNTNFVEGAIVGDPKTVIQPVLIFGSGLGGQIIFRKVKVKLSLYLTK